MDEAVSEVYENLTSFWDYSISHSGKLICYLTQQYISHTTATIKLQSGDVVVSFK